MADPLTTRRLPDGTATRDLFPGNIVLAARINRVAANHVPVWPLPQYTGASFTNLNTFSTFGGGNNHRQIVGKFDHNLSARWKFFGTYARIWGESFSRDPLQYKVNLTRPNVNDQAPAPTTTDTWISP